MTGIPTLHLSSGAPSEGGQYLLADMVADKSGPSEPKRKPARRQKSYVVRFMPSLSPILEESSASASEGSSGSGSARRLASGYGSIHQPTPSEPANESVCICVEEVQGRPSAVFAGRSMERWMFYGSIGLAALGVIMVLIGAIDSSTTGNAPNGSAGLFVLLGAGMFVASVVMCNVLRGPKRSPAVRIVTDAPPA